jgi:hypothetical protein
MLLLTLLLTLPLAESESESGLVAASSLVGVVAMSFSDLEAWREVLRKELNFSPVFRNSFVSMRILTQQFTSLDPGFAITTEELLLFF